MKRIISDRILIDRIEFYKNNGHQKTIDHFNFKEETLQRYLREYKKRFGEISEPPKNIEIIGVLPGDENKDPEQILNLVIAKQQKTKEFIEKRKSQRIIIKDDKPILVACISDLHLGNPNTDYEQIKKDVEMVAQTDGCYAILAGDTNDNWIGKLAFLQREQVMDFDSEIALVKWVISKLGDSLLAVVSGNHELRTFNLAGIDYLQWILENNRLLYDKYEIYFTLELGSASFVFKVRHRWKGTSQYNDTHPIEKDEKFGEMDFDIGIGGHTHNGTLIRPFNHRNRLVYAVLIGTYLMDDRFAVQLGFKNSTGTHNTGCGALMLWPDGNIQGWTSLEKAVKFLKFEREK